MLALVLSEQPTERYDTMAGLNINAVHTTDLAICRRFLSDLWDANPAFTLADLTTKINAEMPCASDIRRTYIRDVCASMLGWA